jgi:hypothetical protein
MFPYTTVSTRTTGYWLSFIDVSYYNPKERSRVLPAIIYASLVLAILMPSSQLELDIAGRN